MSKKVLIIDIGNTATEFAVFENGNIRDFLGFFKLPSQLEETKKVLNSYKNKGLNVDDGMIFSVVPKIEILVQKLVGEIFGRYLPIFDWKHYELGKKNPKIIEPVGADLVADMKQAAKEYGGPCLIADFGTVTKLLYLDSENSFQGLSIIPGIETTLKSFASNTALLPEIDNLNVNDESLGLSTLGSLNHGVYWSNVYYVKDVLKSLNNDKCKLIITGGNLRFLKNEFKDAIIDPELALKGMFILYEEITK